MYLKVFLLATGDNLVTLANRDFHCKINILVLTDIFVTNKSRIKSRSKILHKWIIYLFSVSELDRTFYNWIQVTHFPPKLDKFTFITCSTNWTHNYVFISISLFTGINWTGSPHFTNHSGFTCFPFKVLNE